jgi:hypothetical protein
MSEINFNEKAGFIVAFFASFIALSQFSEEIKKVTLSLGTYHYSLISLFISMALLLFISVYFYACDYTRNFSANENKYSKWLRSAGNFMFSLSLFILPFAFLIHLFSYGIGLISTINMDTKEAFSLVVSIISAMVGMLATLTVTKSITQKQKYETLRTIQSNEERSLKQAEELYQQDFYSPALIEMGKVIEISLQKKLMQNKNIDSINYNPSQLINSALKNNVITSEQVSQIQKIRELRNKAAHLDLSFNKKDAEDALNLTRNILKSLDYQNENDKELNDTLNELKRKSR